MDLLISLIGRVNLIKMAVLPKFLFLFQNIPIACPSLFTTIDSLISKFIWSFKHVRIKLSRLKCSPEKGGINLPDFKLYYHVAQLRSVWFWSKYHIEGYTPSWLNIEQNICQPLMMKSLKYIDNIEDLGEIMKNPILNHTLKCWQNCQKRMGSNNKIYTCTPLWNNPTLPFGFSDGILHRWKQAGIYTIGDLCKDGLFKDFSSVKNKYSLTSADSYKYLQLKSWIKAKTGKSFPKINESPLGLEIETMISPKKLIAELYSMINKHCKYEHLIKKELWEKDLGKIYTTESWEKILGDSQTILSNTRHRLIQLNLINRTYYSPSKLHQFYKTSSSCPRCNQEDADIFHMFWKCCKLKTYWNEIFAMLCLTLQKQLPNDPSFALLGDVEPLSTANLNRYEKTFALLAMAAAKKCILVFWKNKDPQQSNSDGTNYSHTARQKELNTMLLENQKPLKKFGE